MLLRRAVDHISLDDLPVRHEDALDAEYGRRPLLADGLPAVDLFLVAGLAKLVLLRLVARLQLLERLTEAAV